MKHLAFEVTEVTDDAAKKAVICWTAESFMHDEGQFFYYVIAVTPTGTFRIDASTPELFDDEELSFEFPSFLAAQTHCRLREQAFGIEADAIKSDAIKYIDDFLCHQNCQSCMYYRRCENTNPQTDHCTIDEPQECPAYLESVEEQAQ